MSERTTVCGAGPEAASMPEQESHVRQGTNTCFSKGGFCRSVGLSDASEVVIYWLFSTCCEAFDGSGNRLAGDFSSDVGDATMSIVTATWMDR